MITDVERRKRRNDELQERMEDPTDALNRYSTGATWFPERPKIEKDKKSLEALYGKKTTIRPL